MDREYHLQLEDQDVQLWEYLCYMFSILEIRIFKVLLVASSSSYLKALLRLEVFGLRFALQLKQVVTTALSFTNLCNNI